MESSLFAEASRRAKKALAEAGLEDNLLAQENYFEAAYRAVREERFLVDRDPADECNCVQCQMGAECPIDEIVEEKILKQKPYAWEENDGGL